MPPRRTSNSGALVDALVEDMRMQVATSVNQTLSDFAKRLGRLERYFDTMIDTTPLPVEMRQRCALCNRRSVARGFCSAHYQQLRYRERKIPRRRKDSELEPQRCDSPREERG